MSFTKGQQVRGVVTGKFIVVKCHIRDIDGVEIVTVKQVSPEGFVSSSTMKFPADVLVAC
jgi:hypothetical protein